MIPALCFRAVRRTFGEPGGGRRVVIDGLDLTVRADECVALIGPSGCGKTTVLRLASGLLEPDSGRIEIFGLASEQARRRKMLGMMFQAPALLPWRTAVGNVRLPLEVNRASPPPRDRALDLLDRMGLAAFADYRPDQLSGGMQQRVALARTLVSEPELLLMDEPFSALDELTRAQLQSDFVRLRTARPIATLLVTHSIDEAVRLGDRVVVLSGRPARVVGDVPIDLGREARSDPAVVDAAAARACAAELRSLLR